MISHFSYAFIILVSMHRELIHIVILQIINLNKGGTNRDMEKMLKQINDLCDKLDG